MVKPWEIISTQMAFDHRWYQVRRDVVRLPDGRIVDDFFVSVRPDIAMVVPIDESGCVVLVRQYRHGNQHISLEFPGGIVLDENPEVAAHRELEEETGLRAGDLTDLGAFFTDPARNTNSVHLFLALDCKPAGRRRLDENEASSGLEVVRLPLAAFADAVDSGAIASLSSVVAAYRALRHLQAKR